jgi:hypothetical protein
MYLQKVISKKTFFFKFVDILKVTEEKSRIRSLIRFPRIRIRAILVLTLFYKLLHSGYWRGCVTYWQFMVTQIGKNLAKPV